MALKLLDDIRAAEDGALKLTQNAQREARDIIKSAQEDILGAQRRVNGEIREEYQTLLARRRRAVQEDIRLNANSKQREIQALTQQAKSRLPQAAKAIFERVLSDGNR